MEQPTVICIAAEVALLREVKFAMTEMALPAILFAQAAILDTYFQAKPASLFAENKNSRRGMRRSCLDLPRVLHNRHLQPHNHRFLGLFLQLPM